MNPEKKREVRSFLVGRDPSVDRRYRPRPERQVCLFGDIGDTYEENGGEEDLASEYSVTDENFEYQTHSSTNTVVSDTASNDSINDGALVYLRMRPLKHPSTSFETRGNVLVVKPSSESNSTSNNKQPIEKQFSFTDIFDPEIPQASVYENCVRSQIESEESFTLLTYGTSGSGKTFTLLGDETHPGMVPRAIEQIFRKYEKNIYESPAIKLINGRITLIEDSEMLPDIQMRERLLRDCTETPKIQLTRSSIIQDHKFTDTEIDDASVLIWISFVEIYNENVYDLLASAPITTQKMAPPTRINLRLMGNDGKAFIRGVTSVYVKSSVEALHLLHSGLQHVSYASTSINNNSSRSHCIFLIDVLKFSRCGRYKETSYKFCDLAGSERMHKTGNIGERLKETQRINTSLHVLGRCLNAATSTRRKYNDIIPFRDSKLTMLLQAALLGKEKLTMIVNVTPADSYYEENLNVLGFASIARNIAFQKPEVKTQKQRCSFLFELPQKNALTEHSNELLEENIFLRSEIDRFKAKLEEKKSLMAVQLINQEQELRKTLAKSRDEIVDKLTKHFECRIRMELERQKSMIEGKYEGIIRRLQWEIEDLNDEIDQDDAKRRSL